MANVVQIIINAKNNASRALNAPIKDLGDLRKAMSALKPVAITAGVATATALGVITGKAIAAADELYKASQAVGTTVESLSTLKYAAELAGVPFESLKTGLQKFNKNSIEASMGIKGTGKEFELLGIQVRGANGVMKTSDELLGEVADKFAAMPNSAAKTTLAMNLFGKSVGPDLIPLLNEGKDGIEALKQEARDLGLEVSTKFGKNAERFKDNISKLTSVSMALGNTIADKVLPQWVSFSDGLIESYKNSGQVKEAMEQVAGAIGFISKAAIGAEGTLYIYFQGVGNSLANLAAASALALQGRFSEAMKLYKDGAVQIKKEAADALAALAKVMEGGSLSGQGPEEPKKPKKKDPYEVKATKDAWDTKVKIVSEALGVLAQLSESKNKEIAAAGKAFAIAQATVDTYAAANKALASAPPPWSFIAMASAIAAGLLNVAKISGVELAEGGVVKATPGGINAVIGEGGKDEAVIPLENGQMSGSQVSHATVELNGRTLLDFIWEASKSGQLRISPRAVYA